MCGICGVVVRRGAPDPALVDRMCRQIVHRGPDGQGIHVGPGVGLGARRLAVIDPAGGDQPMHDEDGSVHVVFNGELYNHPELRRRLVERSHRLTTRCDTEVLPHLWEEEGRGLLERLRGIFAFALWDDERRTLLLARDRLGVKPLFYVDRGDSLYFGSEVKCLLAAGASEGRIDPLGLDELLTFEYTASPTTLLADVRKLPPGGWLTWRDGRVETGLYWDPRTAAREALERRAAADEDAGDARAVAERLRDTFTEAVRRQMVSDVPLGAFLSGGIDSSILVATMSRVSSEPVRTFSIGFENRSYDELDHARRVAEHCGTEHVERILAPGDLGLVDRLIEHLDQPIADFSVFPTYLVSRVAREHVTVALSGDGGDELFGGYDTYLADAIARRSVDLLPGPVRRGLGRLAASVPPSRSKRGLRDVAGRFLEGAALPRSWEHLRWMTFLTPERRAELYLPGLAEAVDETAEELVGRLLDAGGAAPTPLERQTLCDLRHYLPEDILPKVDLMSMAVSLEARVPYLDETVVDLALEIPPGLKLRRSRRKHILREAFARDLPPGALERGKEGFSIPMKNWLRGEWSGLMRDLLSEDALRRQGLFRPDTVRRWMDEHERGAANHSHVLWALMVLRLWEDRFLRGSFPTGTVPAAGRARVS